MLSDPFGLPDKQENLPLEARSVKEVFLGIICDAFEQGIDLPADLLSILIYQLDLTDEEQASLIKPFILWACDHTVSDVQAKKIITALTTERDREPSVPLYLEYGNTGNDDGLWG